MSPKLLLTFVVLGFILSLTSATPDGTCPEVDPPTGPGVDLADKDDCGSFYACSGGIAIHMHCPHGTYWQISTNYCIKGASVADCGDRPTTVASV